MDSCIEESKDYERYVQVGGEHFRMIGRPIKRLIARQSYVCMRAAGNPNGRAGSDGYWLRMSYGQVSASSALVFPQIPGTYKVFRCCAGCCEGCAMAKSAKGAVQAAVAAVRLLLTVRW